MARKTYTYEITTTASVFPRHLADMLRDKFLQTHLVSIKDCQRDDHVYGDTYKVMEPQAQESMTFKQMVAHYLTLREQRYNSTPEQHAYNWIMQVLAHTTFEESDTWNWDGNMGLLSSYVGEFIEVVQQFQAHCERIGKFAEEGVLEQAWNDLQAVPSYVEQQARAWAAELCLEVEA